MVLCYIWQHIKCSPVLVRIIVRVIGCSKHHGSSHPPWGQWFFLKLDVIESTKITLNNKVACHSIFYHLTIKNINKMKITVKGHMTSSPCNWLMQLIHRLLFSSLMFPGKTQEEKQTISVNRIKKMAHKVRIWCMTICCRTLWNIVSEDLYKSKWNMFHYNAWIQTMNKLEWMEFKQCQPLPLPAHDHEALRRV